MMFTDFDEKRMSIELSESKSQVSHLNRNRFLCFHIYIIIYFIAYDYKYSLIFQLIKCLTYIEYLYLIATNYLQICMKYSDRNISVVSHLLAGKKCMHSIMYGRIFTFENTSMDTFMFNMFSLSDTFLSSQLLRD